MAYTYEILKSIDHLAYIEIDARYTDGVVIPKVVIFNRNKISADEAIKFVQYSEYNPYVQVVSLKQFHMLFLDEEMSMAKEGQDE